MKNYIKLIKCRLKFNKLSYYEKYLFVELLDKNEEYRGKIKLLQEMINDSKDYTSFTLNRLLLTKLKEDKKQVRNKLINLIPEIGK